MARTYPSFEKLNLRIVAVSVDTLAESKQMKQELGLPFPLLCDREGKAVRQYGLLHQGGGQDEAPDIARPAELLIDAEGVIRWAAFTDAINVRTEPDVVLAEAARLK